MSSLTTYGVSKDPWVAPVGGTAVIAMSQYATLSGFTVANPSASSWGYLHLFDANTATGIVIGQTRPTYVIPVVNGQTVARVGLPGIVFMQGVVAMALTGLNSGVGVATDMVASLEFNGVPSY